MFTPHAQILARRSAFAKQAAADWQSILLARAAELVPGGRFICLNPGIDAEGTLPW